MSNVIQLIDRVQFKASGVFVAVNIAARRMGYSDTLAVRAARLARREVLQGGKSPARVVSDIKADLRHGARREPSGAA